MAEGTIHFTNYGIASILKGDTPWGGSTIKCALISGTPNKDSTNVWDDLDGTEITATNYTAGGVELTDATPSEDDTNDRVVLDASDPSWTDLGVPSATITAAVVYEATGTPSTSPVICWIELTTQPNGGDYTIQLPATGLGYVSNPT